MIQTKITVKPYILQKQICHIVLIIPGSTQPLPTVETSPRVENTESDLEIEITKVVPGNLFQEDRFVKTEQQ